jgi:hypothetical protein
MSLANDWDTLGKAERKASLELAIGDAIDRIAARAGAPTNWQKGKILHAIDATTRGLFDVAATHLGQVFAEGVDRPWPNPDFDPGDLDKVTVATLRNELDGLKARPVQDPPDYL